jgi:hypothetical protein
VTPELLDEYVGIVAYSGYESALKNPPPEVDEYAQYLTTMGPIGAE